LDFCGRIEGTIKRKIAITVPGDLLTQARKSAKQHDAGNLSAYVSGAIKARLMHDDLDALLAELLRETGGPLTKAEIDRADGLLALGGATRSKRRRAA
jgi:hypothetical protein